MRLATLSFALAVAGTASAATFVYDDRIRVFLFGKAAYFAEVAIDVGNDSCASLTNNMIDGKVQSVLVGGRDIWDVFKRDDNWYCILYDNYECEGKEELMLTVAGGVNNLESVGWGDRMHGIWCINDDH